MRSFRKFFSAAILFNLSLIADTIDTKHDINEDDVKAIREWLNTKRQVTIKEKGGALSISGEVHTEFQISNEKKNGIRQRGIGGATDVADKSFDIEADFMMDYRTDRTWAAIRLRFDNNAGIFGGTNNALNLNRAYMGGRFYDGEDKTFDIEIGRRQLGNIFDSKIEFDNLFDGICFFFDGASEKYGNYYAHVGAFIIDERKDHYGYVGEVGLMNIRQTGLYTKYSLIDWDTHDYPCEVCVGKDMYVRLNKRFRFLVSQLILGYRYIPRPLNKVVIIYAAGLLNHKAKAIDITGDRRLGWGAYAGVSVGELKKKDDWSFDINYQLVAPQAIPDFDISGIGLGNASNAGFYTVNLNGTGGATTIKNAAGNGNYRGYQIVFQYLLTNNITLFQSWRDSMTLYSSVGPFRRWKQYEIEFIYGF